MRMRSYLLALCSVGLITACTPRVELAAPKEPININLNVKIEHEILIKVDNALDSIINENSGLF